MKTMKGRGRGVPPNWEARHLYRSGNTGKGLAPEVFPPEKAAREARTSAPGSCHCRCGKSGIGVALNSRLHCRAVQRAHFCDFLRRALSVEIPVPAYICR